MPKQIPLSEVKKHDKRNSVWTVIHDEVYDVTNFLAEHPGGADVLVEAAGKDSTQDFEDVGHSQDARDMMKKYKIGRVSKDDRKEPAPPCPSPCCKATCKSTASTASGRSKTSTGTGRSRSSTPTCNKSRASLKKSGTSISRRNEPVYCDETSCSRLQVPKMPEKTWRTFDCENETRRKKEKPKRKLSVTKPYDAGQPCTDNRLKYALLLLAGLILVGIAVKKFKS